MKACKEDKRSKETESHGGSKLPSIVSYFIDTLRYAPTTPQPQNECSSDSIVGVISCCAVEQGKSDPDTQLHSSYSPDRSSPRPDSFNSHDKTSTK